MTLPTESTATVSVVLLCALAATALLRGRPAALRHWVLATAIACATAAPLLEAVAPSWHVNLPARSASATHASATAINAATLGAVTSTESSGEGTQQVAETSTSFGLAGLIFPIWIAGAAISLSILLIAMARLTWIASRATRVTEQRWLDIADTVLREYGLRRPVLLLQSHHPTLLVTWGLTRSKVILPAIAREWPDDRIRVVLCHELAHVARWDWASQMLGELLRSIYWFDPVLWIACRRLRREGEHACDDAVLNLGIEGPDYATHLLDLARALRNHGRWLPVPAMASPSNLERRIRAMLDSRHNRLGITRSARLSTSLALLAMTMVIAGFTAAAQTSSTVSGSIVDSQGASLADARLVLSNVESKAKYEVRSNRTGQFEFVGITSGDYVLQAIAPGFQTFQTRTTLSGQTLRRDIRMSVGTLEETITVTSGGPARSAEEVLKDELRGQEARAKFQTALAECRGSNPLAGSAIGGQIRPPRKIRDVRPLYPDNARGAGIGGVVKLVATIGTDGLIADVRSVDSTVNPDLVDAATAAVKQWEFDGTLLNCVPVEVEMTVSVGFDPAR